MSAHEKEAGIKKRKFQRLFPLVWCCTLQLAANTKSKGKMDVIHSTYITFSSQWQARDLWDRKEKSSDHAGEK